MRLWLALLRLRQRGGWRWGGGLAAPKFGELRRWGVGGRALGKAYERPAGRRQDGRLSPGWGNSRHRHIKPDTPGDIYPKTE